MEWPNALSNLCLLYDSTIYCLQEILEVSKHKYVDSERFGMGEICKNSNQKRIEIVVIRSIDFKSKMIIRPQKRYM